jgi:hypothetical protein
VLNDFLANKRFANDTGVTPEPELTQAEVDEIMAEAAEGIRPDIAALPKVQAQLKQMPSVQEALKRESLD